MVVRHTLTLISLRCLKEDIANQRRKWDLLFSQILEIAYRFPLILRHFAVEYNNMSYLNLLLNYIRFDTLYVTFYELGKFQNCHRTGSFSLSAAEINSVPSDVMPIEIDNTIMMLMFNNFLHHNLQHCLLICNFVIILEHLLYNHYTSIFLKWLKTKNVYLPRTNESMTV